MKARVFSWGIAAAGLFLGACQAVSPNSGTVTQEGRVNNGISLNGISLNGVSLNGVSLNGVSLNGVSLNGVSLNGVSLNGVSLNGSELVGGGGSLTGDLLDGSEFSGILSDGSSLPMKVDGHWENPDGTHWYSVFYWGDTGKGNKQDWIFLCDGIPLSGRWDMRQGVSGGGSHIDDPNAITFACEGAALAKCVLLGYKPWASYNGTSLRDYHQACTRMIRADYCGNGNTWTTDGRLINAYDRLGIQVDTEGSYMSVDAEWTADGANCVHKARADELMTSENQPTCFPLKVNDMCGNFNNSLVVMVNESEKVTGGGGGGKPKK